MSEQDSADDRIKDNHCVNQPLKGSTGRSSWTNFWEEAQKRHNRRIEELHEEETERVVEDKALDEIKSAFRAKAKEFTLIRIREIKRSRKPNSRKLWFLIKL